MARLHSGFVIQSNFGVRGNFEAVVPGRTTGLLHLWRNNDSPMLQWSAPNLIAEGVFGPACLIQSNLGSGPGNLEVVVRQGSELMYLSRPDQAPLTWSTPVSIAGGVSGNPAMIQGKYGFRGNFELVVPAAAGGIAHYWCENDGPQLWQGPELFGTSAGQVNGVALILSGFGERGHLEVIATAGAGLDRTLLHFWRDESEWHGPTQITLPAAFGSVSPDGVPGFIQSKDGNFQVVFGGAGHLTHIERDNSDPALPWRPVARFGGLPMTGFSAASILQSNFGDSNYEVLARTNDAGADLVHLNHFWRSPGPDSEWQATPGDLLGPNH